MRIAVFLVCIFLVGAPHPWPAFAGSLPVEPSVASTPLPVAHDGVPACTIVVAAPLDTWLVQQGVNAIRTTVQRWSGAELPVQDPASWKRKPAIILATLEGLRRDLPELAAAVPLVGRVGVLDEQGFICTSHLAGDVPCVLIVGRTPRGAHNGAIWLRDFCIDGPRDRLDIICPPTVRAPHLPARAAYTLTIWKHEAEYTVADWETIFDSYARDGFDRVYFWVSGHFPSTKFPQAYRCRDGEWDTTEKSRIATIEDLRRLIRAAHDRGLKFYAGGALGGWCCTCMLTDLAPETMKTPKDVPYPPPSSLCPSHPASRQALIAYYQEMFDGLPEADGLFIESADEWGGCYCPVCIRDVDARGSKRFGQSQISLIQEIMGTIWRDHPHARLCYTIGYDEHRNDPAYYEAIRQMNDPRFEWMEARNRWAFPGLEGSEQSAVFFSRQVMRWQQYYARPLDQMVEDAARVAESGMFGLITAFEPGFATGSLHTDIPYPTDVLPYVLTGFVWREATWGPTASARAMRERVRQRFFGGEAAGTLAEDLWELRELIREAAGARKFKPVWDEKLSRIAEHIQQARASASPKTTDTLDLMSKAVADLRSHLARPSGTTEQN